LGGGEDEGFPELIFFGGGVEAVGGDEGGIVAHFLGEEKYINYF
jgi:hypothetical protein